MKRLSILLLSVVVVFASCNQGKKSDDKDQKEEKKQDQQEASADKYLYEAEDGSFVIVFPGEPDKSTEPVSVSGVDVKKHTISYAPSPVQNFTLVYMDFPQDQFKGKEPMKVLKAQKDGIIQNLGGRFVEQKELETEHPGLMFKAKTGNLYGTYHLYLYKDRLFQLSVINKGSFAEDVSFLESFKLHKN